MRAGRVRCPRCRTYVTAVDPKAAAAAAAVRSRKLQRITGGIAGVFVLLIGVLWLTREPAPSTIAVPNRPSDSLASRRPPKTPPRAVQLDNDSTPAQTAPQFLEPAGAGALAYDSGDYQTALQHFQAAVERNPKDSEALSNLGQVLVRLGRTPEAIPYFERAIQVMPTRWAYQFNLARALGLTGKWDDAIATYRKAQDLFPDDYATTFNLALALHKKGDEAGAVDQYKRAIELNPDDASFRMALATSYERLQKPADAAAAYQEYLRLSPSTPDADKVRTRIVLLTGGTAPAASSTPAAAPGPG